MAPHSLSWPHIICQRAGRLSWGRALLLTAQSLEGATICSAQSNNSLTNVCSFTRWDGVRDAIRARKLLEYGKHSLFPSAVSKSLHKIPLET